MKFTALITAGLLSASALAKQAAYKYERLDKNDAVSCLGEKPPVSDADITRSSSLLISRKVSTS
jgi:hypothetical protein